MTRARLYILLMSVVALAIAASPALAEPKCVRVRGTAQGVQSGDAFSPLQGLVEIRFRGRVYEGIMTWLATDAGLPCVAEASSSNEVGLRVCAVAAPGKPAEQGR